MNAQLVPKLKCIYSYSCYITNSCTGLQVADPQCNGMGEGEYDSAGLLCGWNHGNAFSYCVFLHHQSDFLPHTLAATTLEAAGAGIGGAIN